MNRDAIRAATLGRNQKSKTKLVNISKTDDGQDIAVELRQPSVRARSAILKRSKAHDRDRLDLAELQVTAIIECAYEPGTSNKVFGEADRETLAEMPAGSFVDELAAAALELLNVDAGDLEKN
jgi:hypothetical protein